MLRSAVISLVAIANLIPLIEVAPAADIVGGRPASRRYPFMVAVQYPEAGYRPCGGTLIRRDVVLTAAHCVASEPPETIEVMVGSHRISHPGKIIGVESIRVHEKYNPNSYANDIALLFLSTAADQRPIKVASSGDRDRWEPGDLAIALGWGRDAFPHGRYQDQLHEVELPIVDDADCSRVYGFGFGFDPNVMLCAGERTGGKASCNGDSGGPLIAKSRGGGFVQVGTVSWGVGCGWPAFYDVYARVGDTNLRRWIRDNNI